MSGFKSHRILCFLIIFCISLIFGCSTPILKMPKKLPPEINEYKHVILFGSKPGMVNTGLHLNIGDFYSIFATGRIDFCPNCPAHLYWLHDVEPSHGWPFMGRIGKTPYSLPFKGSYYNLSGTTRIADSTGYLYLGVRDPNAVDKYGNLTERVRGTENKERATSWYYDDNRGSFSVDIIFWKAVDLSQIVGFLEKIKENEQNKEKANEDNLRAITDAIDMAKKLPQEISLNNIRGNRGNKDN